MKLVEFNHGFVSQVDSHKYDLSLGYTWRITGSGKRTRYAVTSVPKDPAIGWTSGYSVLSLHRLVLGSPDMSLHVDHIDGDGLNNQLSNLRLCSRTENGRNRRTSTNNTSGWKGVKYVASTGKFSAIIKFNGMHLFIGSYQIDVHAAQAYNIAAICLFREFANLNKLPEGIEPIPVRTRGKPKRILQVLESLGHIVEGI